jgi:hypothetical protein
VGNILLFASGGSGGSKVPDIGDSLTLLLIQSVFEHAWTMRRRC